MKRVLLALVVLAVVAGGAALYIFRDGSGSGAITEAARTQAAPPQATASANPELMAPGPLEDQVLGDPNAPVTIIEYASLTCPHCAAFQAETLPALKAKYIDTGKVKLIFREFPLDNYASAGFMLARCAGPGKYFPIVDAFFKQQKGLMAATEPFEWVQNFAKQVGFTQESMESCLTNQQLLDGVMGMRQRAAEKFGVSSTPTFFINGKVHRGAMTMQEVEQELAPLLRS
jgi:protein-disulfide isomerase